MHALALEFTYLWKLNREHWLGVWRHICMWPQLWTGASAFKHARARSRAHTHTHRGFALNSWECLQCERAVRSLRLAQWPKRCLCLHCTQSSNSVCFRPLCHSGALWGWLLLKTHTKLSRLGPRVALATQGPSSLRNQGEFQKCTWYMSPCVVPSWYWYCFQHSTQGHGDIKHVLFHSFFHFFFDKSQWQSSHCRVVGTASSQNHAFCSYSYILEWVKLLLKRSHFCLLNYNSLKPHTSIWFKTRLSPGSFASNFLGISLLLW